MLASQELEKRRAAVDHLAGLEMRIAAPLSAGAPA